MKSSALRDKLKEIVYGFSISQGLYCVAVLGLADYLQDGPKTYEEIAAFAHADPGAIKRILRLLAQKGIFREDEQGRFLLTFMGEFLRTDAKESMRTEILHMLHPSSWTPWGDLLYSLKTGRAAFPKCFGTNVWEYRAQHRDVSTVFDDMTTTMSQREAEIVCQNLDMENCREIIDIGGGKGGLIAAILSRKKNLRGVLFEQSHVLTGAQELLHAAGVQDRCRIMSGDFFSSVPPGGDVYLLKSIIHNWDDEAAIAILKNCRQAMTPKARIALIESIISPQEPFRYLMDIHMLVIHGGKERTPEEFKILFDVSGFRLRHIVTDKSGISLIEGIPV